MMEKWTSIKGLKGLYEVSTRGRVRRLAGTYGCHKTRIIKDRDCKGYRVITLSKNNKARHFRVNRLVAINFIPNPQNKPATNHINGNPSDNRVENLEWVTVQENVNHMHEVTKKAKNPRIKVRCINTRIEFKSIRDAATSMGLDDAAVYRCISGEYYHTKGFMFERI